MRSERKKRSWGVCIKKKIVFIYVNALPDEQFHMGCAAVKPEMLQCDTVFITSAALAFEGCSPWRVH